MLQIHEFNDDSTVTALSYLFDTAFSEQSIAFLKITWQRKNDINEKVEM